MSENLAVARFLSRIGPELAATFNPAQRAAIGLHFGMRYQVEHLIDWRQRIRLPLSKFYVVLLIGRDMH